MKIEIPISCGELVDKLSILEIKKTEIKNEEKLKQVLNEFNALKEIYKKIFMNSKEIEKFYKDLLIVNKELWEIEDKLRKLEKEEKFDRIFIELARSVYITNDRRFSIKKAINEMFGSEIQEQKDY
tara:strand:+ start:562 stop:939 length:378 start_codon:yes stop_codon:yes gene_type:complete